MTSSLAHFGVGFLLSFTGSLPPGLINLSVADVMVTRGRQPAFYLAIGAALIEGIQVLLAIKCASWFVRYPGIETSIQYLAIPVFFCLAIYFLFKKNSKRTIKTRRAGGRDFLKGVLLSCLNFLAIPFWLFYGAWLGAEGWLDNDLLILIFTAGAFLGTVILLMLYAWLSLKIVRHLQVAERLANRSIGFLFLALGIWQLWHLAI